MINIFSEFLDDHLLQYVHPVVEANTGKLHFFEVLSRVKFKGRIYAPSEFLNDISIAQKYRMAKKIFTEIALMQKEYPTVSFSMNISSLEVDMGLADFLISLNDTTHGNGIDSSRCIIELTEQSLIDTRIYSILQDLKSKTKFRFALDDFGVKYSNLSLVCKEENVFDYIKVDGSLVENIDTNSAKRITLNHFIQIIKTQGKKSIVEYISSKEIYNAVKISNPEYLQGFLFGEPAPIEAFILQQKDISIFMQHLDMKVKNVANF